MKERDPSKHIREISIDKAAEKVGGVYSLIVYASMHAREIAKRRNKIDAKQKKLNDYGYTPINQALDDFQKGNI